jgi:hypothetical protein
MAEEIKTVLTADSSALAAEFAKASSIAQRYASEREAAGGRALASARAEVGALQLEATGHGAAAAAVREKMQLIEGARRLSEQAGISEENANSILARQLELKKQITSATQATAVAAQRAARIEAPGRSGIVMPELALTPARLQAMEVGAARANELRRQLVRVGGGGRNGALGVLAFSQGLEDAQYGIRGVLNNIPQMVLGFGGGAGIAGAISIAAVSAVVLYPHLKRLYGAVDNEVLRTAGVEWARVFTQANKAAQAREQSAARTREMAEWSRQTNQTLSAELGIHDQILQSMGEQIAIREKSRGLATELRTAEEALGSARGNASDPTAGRKEELERLAEDIRSQREISERAQSEAERLSNVRRNNRASLGGDEASKNTEIDALRRDLAGAEANVAAYQKTLDEAKKAKTSTYNDTRNVNVSTAARDELKTRIADLEAMRDAAKAQADSADATAAEAIRQMDEKSNKAYQEANALQAVIAQRKQLLAVDKATRAATRERAATDWQAELAIQRALGANDLERVRALERQRDVEAEKRRILLAQNGISAEIAGQQAATMVDARAAAAGAAAAAAAATAKNNFSEELEILRARAASQNDLAGQLRSAATLEREVLAIMQQQNVSRAEATRMSRDRTELERNAARGDVMGDLKALQMEAGGDKTGADRLREEMRIRQEAVGMAERLGISESDAADKLREKARLQKQISDQEKAGARDSDDGRGRRRSRIYTLPQAERSEAGSFGLARFSGLRNAELDRRSSERSNRAAAPADDSAANLLKSVNIQQEMLTIWQKLNVV